MSLALMTEPGADRCRLGSEWHRRWLRSVISVYLTGAAMLLMIMFLFDLWCCLTCCSMQRQESRSENSLKNWGKEHETEQQANKTTIPDQTTTLTIINEGNLPSLTNKHLIDFSSQGHKLFFFSLSYRHWNSISYHEISVRRTDERTEEDPSPALSNQNAGSAVVGPLSTS